MNLATGDLMIMDNLVLTELVGAGKSQAGDSWCEGKSYIWYLMKGACQTCAGQDEDKLTGKTFGQAIPHLWDGHINCFPDKDY